MKTILFSIAGLFLLIVSCKGDKQYEVNEVARDNARTYMRGQLGEGAQYEEVSWGKVEPRKVDWQNSNRYKLFQDTVVMMQDRLRLMNDSLEAELRLHGPETPFYKTLSLRRDGYQMYFDTYTDSEAEMMQRYDMEPEYYGCWMYHEYKLDGVTHKAYICYDDTSNYKVKEVIYK